MNKLFYKKGFTIFEIVIALTVLAILSMTLTPMIFRDTKTQVYKTSVQKAHTLLQQTSQAIGMLETQGKLDPNDNDAFMKALIMTNKVSCVPSGYSSLVSATRVRTGCDGVVLKNGMEYSKNGNYIMVDINGINKDNGTEGVDMHVFELVDNNVSLISGSCTEKAINDNTYNFKIIDKDGINRTDCTFNNIPQRK